MISKGSSVTKAEALSVIEEYEYAIEEAVKNGNNVNTKLFKLQASITGIFSGKDDTFDPSRHKIRLKLKPGSRLIKAINDIRLRKIEIKLPQPVLRQFVDLKTKTKNESFTAGQIVSIHGSLLKFDESDLEQGIFFIDENSVETRVTNMMKNKPSELIFLYLIL